MDGESIVTVSAAVVALTQLAKWAGVPDRSGPVIVLALSGLGVALWAATRGHFGHAEIFSYFAGWVAVATSAAGVFGFTRAAASSVTRATPPPDSGAGSHHTAP